MNKHQSLSQNRFQTFNTVSCLLKLSLARIEFIAPSEFKLETGRLLMLLVSNPEGLTKDGLIQAFYPDYTNASAVRQMSLVGSLNKAIQRARVRYARFGLTICFCPLRKLWNVLPSELQNNLRVVS